MSIPRSVNDWPRGAILAVTCGIVVLLAIVACCALALSTGTPIGPDRRPLAAPAAELALPYGSTQILAFGAYLAGLWFIRRSSIRVGPVVLLAVAIQLIPLIAPLLTSTDTWFYWNSGRIGSVHGGDPYVDTPATFGEDASLALIPPEWRQITTPYGPLFTLIAQGVAMVAGDSSTVAALLFRTIACISIIAIVLLVSRLAARAAFAAAFVGWNPLVALNFAGAGHNDALMMFLVVSALALAARRPQLAGAAWAAAIFIKVVPLVFIPLYLVERRARGRSLGLLGFVIGLTALAVIATLTYGLDWGTSIVSIFRVATRQGIGGPASPAFEGPKVALLLLATMIFAAGYVVLLRRAARGHARLGVAAVMVLVVVLISPQILWPWYLIWAIPLVALDDDPWPQLAVLALCAYELNFLGDAGTILSNMR